MLSNIAQPEAKSFRVDATLGAEQRGVQQSAPDAASARRQRYGALECVCVSDRDGFYALKPAWQKLFEGSATPSQFFQSHDWLAAWLETHMTSTNTGTAQQLAIVAGYQDGELVMIWPLVRRRRFGFTILSWMGAPVTQYGDVLIARSAQTQNWLACGLDFITRELRPDAVKLCNVREDSPLRAISKSARLRTLRTQHAPFIDLTQFSSMDAFRATYSKRTRKTRARKRRRFFEHPKALGEIVAAGARATKLTRTAIQLKRDWLESRNICSRALSSGTFDSFLMRIAQKRTASFRTMVSSLSQGAKPLAIELGFVSKNTYFSHLAAYDVAAHSLSAGMLQFEDTINDCISNGITQIDLLAPSDAYKMDWTKKSVAVYDFGKAFSPVGALFLTMNGPAARQFAKALLQWLPYTLQRRLLGSAT